MIATPPSSSPSTSLGPRPSGLRRRIGAGFILVLVLHLMVVALNYLVLDRTSESTDRATRTHARVADLLAMDRNVETLQGNVLSFMYTGDRKLSERVIEGIDGLLEVLSIHAADPDNASAHADIERMIEALGAYGEGFDAVITQRGRREMILKDSVRPYAEATRAAFASLLSQAGSRESIESVVQVGLALQRFAQAEDTVAGYQLAPSGQVARMFRDASTDFASALDRLQIDSFPPAGQQLLLDIQAGLPPWNQAVYQVVSSTRSFLHLVDVVLAGHALEFRTLSSRVNQGAFDAQARADAHTQSSRTRFRALSDWAGILTVVAGILAGWWVSRSLSAPITEMSKTFSALAAGKQVPIAGIGRDDEIGELASAAQVFAERNQETRELLERADTMATERDATNRALEKHVQELKLRNEDLDSFSYSASHDLRAPLRSIYLLAEWIQDDAGDILPEECATHLETLIGRVSRLDGILDGLLAYARVGRTGELFDSFSVRALVEEAIEPWSNNVSVSLSIEGEDVEVTAARVALHKVVQNLVGNAISHHDKDVALVSVTIQEEAGDLVLTVEDDGPGIPLHLHERVFQMFRTAKPRDEHEGSGIGLSIVQKIVQNTGGSICLESQPGHGCLFSVRWPLTVIPTTEALAS